jgi:hypothetical protein
MTTEVKAREVKTLAEKVIDSWKEGSPEKAKTFFDRQISKLEFDIKTAKGNKSQLKIQYDIKKEEISYQIQDAEINVNSAYLAIKEENIATNESSDTFAGTYWNNIEKCEETLAKLLKESENAKDAYDEARKAVDIQIKIRETRIAKIKGEI